MKWVAHISDEHLVLLTSYFQKYNNKHFLLVTFMSALHRKLVVSQADASSESGTEEFPSNVTFTDAQRSRRNDINYDNKSPLPWSNYFSHRQILPLNNVEFCIYEYRADEGPIFALHHGAGLSALSFALLSKELVQRLECNCSVIAYDCRGHGETRGKVDYSLTTLSDDFLSVVKALYPNSARDIFLVGHSMGGAVVVDAAMKHGLPSLAAVVVVDVVEGTALASLPYMQGIIDARPTQFTSVMEAIQWSLDTRLLKNQESMRVSIPSLIIEKDGVYHWRTDLRHTSTHWHEWFTGLSSRFLQCPAAKLLVLAGTDRLDRTLTIAQMQGKFQLSLLPTSGHSIQEDEPVQLAEILATFATRQQRLLLPIKAKLVRDKASAAATTGLNRGDAVSCFNANKQE